MLRASLLALLVLIPAVLGATTMRRLSLEELAQRAELVVLATPGERGSFWVGGRIYTRTRVAVEEVWVGEAEAGRGVSVLTLGGVVGTIGQRVDGEARLPPGKRSVLFLVRDAKLEGYRVLGMEQGEWLVPAPASDGPRTGGGSVSEGAPPMQSIGPDLQSFKRHVQELADAP